MALETLLAIVIKWSRPSIITLEIDMTTIWLCVFTILLFLIILMLFRIGNILQDMEMRMLAYTLGDYNDNEEEYDEEDDLSEVERSLYENSIEINEDEEEPRRSGPSIDRGRTDQT